jgi:hypothetical protein
MTRSQQPALTPFAIGMIALGMLALIGWFRALEMYLPILALGAQTKGRPKYA